MRTVGFGQPAQRRPGASGVGVRPGLGQSALQEGDQIRPISQGGTDIWQNVVAACRRCNNHKGGRTPEQAHMQLIAVPFAPTYAEYIYLKGRRILADQMDFLRAHFPRKSPLHERIDGKFAQRFV